jgi:hypothetical protein
MSLQLDIRQGDVLRIGEAEIMLRHKTGSKARLEISAPRSINVLLEKEGQPHFTQHRVKPMAQECSCITEEHSHGTNHCRIE